mmetsp:Transcript_5817/g.8435  ORF Transcript_5817/g.8435 Transcript_5817/m.8435 type:complete len:230 (+) Transcript_5817:1577-2266(+)
MTNPHLLHDMTGPDTRREGPPKDAFEFRIQSTDSQLLEIEIARKDGSVRPRPTSSRRHPCTGQTHQGRSLRSTEGELGMREELSHGHDIDVGRGIRFVVHGIHAREGVYRQFDLGSLEVRGEDLSDAQHVSVVILEYVRCQSIGVDLPWWRFGVSVIVVMSIRTFGQEVDGEFEGDECSRGIGSVRSYLDAGAEGETAVSPLKAVEGYLVVGDGGIGFGSVEGGWSSHR